MSKINRFLTAIFKRKFLDPSRGHLGPSRIHPLTLIRPHFRQRVQELTPFSNKSFGAILKELKNSHFFNTPSGCHLKANPTKYQDSYFMKKTLSRPSCTLWSISWPLLDPSWRPQQPAKILLISFWTILYLAWAIICNTETKSI